MVTGLSIGLLILSKIKAFGFFKPGVRGAFGVKLLKIAMC